MAVVNYTTSEGPGRHFIVVTWPAMATGDTGDPIMLPEWADKTFQATGTFGGATVTLEGSNNKADWDILRDPRGAPTTNDISVTAQEIRAVLENPLWIRPVVTGGTGVSVAVTVTATQKRVR